MSREIINRYKILAKKSLGQNFLINDTITYDISELISVPGRNVIEVGPGYGALTEKLLLQKPKSLHLIELDNDMVEILEHRITLGELPIQDIDFHIYNVDVLESTPEFSQYSVIANIPYYITSPILRHFLYNVENKPSSMIILMQKDVGDKILGKGKNKSSVLSLMIEKKCSVTEEIFVGKENFIPAPKIESSVLKFESHNKYDEIEDEKFLEIIKLGFTSPRKKLIKNLSGGGFNQGDIEDFLCQQGKDVNMRGEDGDIEFWIKLSKNLL